MDRQVAGTEPNSTRVQSPRPGHLMCRSSLWGVTGFLACAYFAWISFRHVVQGEFDWPHDGWTIITYAVWILLLAGLALDTRCLRERMFFGVLVINFLVGLGLAVWSSVPGNDVRTARVGTGALWGLAALVSLSTIGRARAVAPQEKTP